MYCYWGNEVALESQAVAKACYDVDFVGTDIQFQKGLALIIKRSHKPVNMTAGKFTKLSLKMYAWVNILLYYMF